MEALLLQQRDRAAIAQWGVWLAHRDPERGFKVISFQGLQNTITNPGYPVALGP
jgi:hypothetical protein